MGFLLFFLVKLLFSKKSWAKVQRFKTGRRDSKSIQEETDGLGMTRLYPEIIRELFLRNRIVPLSFHQQPDDDINQEHYCYRNDERICFHALQHAIYPSTGRYRRERIPGALAFLPGRSSCHGISGGERG